MPGAILNSLLQASREKLLHTHIISVSHSELDAEYLSLHQQWWQGTLLDGGG